MAEIAYSQVAVLINEYTMWLQITVNDAGRVNVF